MPGRDRIQPMNGKLARQGRIAARAGFDIGGESPEIGGILSPRQGGDLGQGEEFRGDAVARASGMSRFLKRAFDLATRKEGPRGVAEYRCPHSLVLRADSDIEEMCSYLIRWSQ